MSGQDRSEPGRFGRPPADFPYLPSRPRESHKGTFGTVVVVGGSHNAGDVSPVMLGAPALTGLAALRSGTRSVRAAFGICY